MRFWIFGLCFFPVLAPAIVPRPVEVAYSKAVLSYHDGHFPDALRMLDGLNQLYPTVVEIKELGALTLKQMGRFEQAGVLYQELIRSRRTWGATDSEMVPYIFELGVIRFQQKNYKEAEEYFLESQKYRFNLAASRFFLGMMAFQQDNLEAARQHFDAVTGSGVDALKPASYLYLGRILGKNQKMLASLKYYRHARRLASKQMGVVDISNESRQASQQIVTTVDGVMDALRAGRFFASVGLVSAYDSNVLFTSTFLDSPAEGATGRGSFKSILQFGGGYSPSPLSAIQIIPTYSGSLNYNYNRSTQSGEAFSNNFSVFVTKQAGEPSSFGLKLGAMGMFTNTLDSSTGLYRYRTYSLAGTLGPFGQIEVRPNWALGGELFYQPQRFFLDSDVAESYQKTGALYSTRIYIKNDNFAGRWNPGLFLAYNIRNTTGIEYRYRSWSLTFNNKFYVSSSTVVAASINAGASAYDEREGKERKDTPVSLGVNTLYRFSSTLNFFLDLNFSRHYSNLDIPYEFSRYLVAFSANYRF